MRANYDIASRLSNTLRDWESHGLLATPMRVDDYARRAQELPLLAYQSQLEKKPELAGLVGQPRLFTITEMKNMGLIPFRAQLTDTVSPLSLMLLIAFEANPEPLNWVMRDYKPSQFFAYIYEDVAARFTLLPQQEKEKERAVISWLTQTYSQFAKTPQRYIRRRLMAMLERSNRQTLGLFNDKEITAELQTLLQKLAQPYLLEANYNCKDNRTAARNDFNLLVDTVMLNLYSDKASEQQKQDYLRFSCPADIVDFSTVIFDLPKQDRSIS